MLRDLGFPSTNLIQPERVKGLRSARMNFDFFGEAADFSDKQFSFHRRPPYKHTERVGMRKYVGIWIDFEKAYVVSFEKSKEVITRINSDVAGRVRLAGGSRSATPYGPQDVASERKVQERRKHHLRRYYEAVIKAIEDADRILIFGPGEAKLEVEKEIRKSKLLGAKIAAVERTDKMTERQIAAKVRDFFGLTEDFV